MSLVTDFLDIQGGFNLFYSCTGYCLFIILSPNRLMPTALRFAQQEACNSITHGVRIMSRALARIHYFSYVSLNFYIEAIHSFTKRGFWFQPFSLMSAHSIRLLAEAIPDFLVLLVVSGIFSISVPSCCNYPCWQLDTDTSSNSVLAASAAWAQPFVCREGPSAPPSAALCRDACPAGSCRQCKYITVGPLRRMVALQRGGMLEPSKRCC